MTTIRKQTLKTVGGAVLLFCVCCVLFSSMRNNIWFMDEMDNFHLGLQMTKGGVLYQTLFSQHMPLPYYISALFARLGAHSVLAFRLCWYVFLSGCYTAVYLRYAKWYGRVPMLLWSVFYLFSITTTELCTSILAEQLQAVGMVLLCLEFLHFTQTREISRASAVCIALGVHIAFLSAFVAAFACLAMAVGFLLVEITFCVRTKTSFFSYFFRKYALTLALLLAPLLLLALYFVVTGVWGDFFYKAVIFNTEVYSRYQDGFGASPLGAVAGAVTQYINVVKRMIQTLFQGARNLPYAVIFLQLAQWVFLLCLAARRRVFTAAWLLVFFLSCGTRGFYNYHALQCFALSCVMLALLAGGLYRAARARKLPALTGTLAGVLCAAFIAASGSFVWQHRAALLPAASEFSPEYEAHSNEALLLALADEDEYVFENINNEDLYLSVNIRAPSYNTAPSPWWWEATREASMAAITADPPRIAIYDGEYSSWGYAVKDFAPELDAFIRENYTLLYDDAPAFYVRSDCAAQMRKQLADIGEDMVGCTEPNTTCGDALSTGAVQQYFTATRDTAHTISVQFGTHNRPYGGTVTAALTDADGTVLGEWTLAPNTIADNAFAFLLRDTDTPVALTVGERYCLTLTAQGGDGNITVWASENEATAASCAETADGVQAYNLRVKVR